MNPFDLGMVEPLGFYAFNNIELVKDKPKKTILSDVLMFYNPSWSLLGDFISGTSSKRFGGSHYYNSKDSRNYHWRILDQLIFTKSLYEQFNQETFKLLESEHLCKEINKAKSSDSKAIDHLPLYFSFNI